MKYQYLFVLIGAILFSSCKKDPPQSQAVIDQSRIKSYLSANRIIAQQDSSGLYYVILNEGDSIHRPTLASTVNVNYMGTLLNGTVFTSTTNANDSTTTPVSLPLAGAIPGWQIGLPKITEGGSILLIIPSALGYGNKPVGTIPANSVLVFQIELISVE